MMLSIAPCGSARYLLGDKQLWTCRERKVAHGCLGDVLLWLPEGDQRPVAEHQTAMADIGSDLPSAW